MSVIKNKDGKWEVVSETTKRKLGTYNTKQEAVERLRQVEYFKAHPKAKSLFLEAAKKRKLDPKAKIRNRGDVVFPANSKKVKDHKDHFPINNADQARNALSRVAQYSSVPPWYSGSLSELKSAVQNAVRRKYSNINVTKGGAELIKNEPHAAVKDPNKDAGKIAPVKIPSLKNLNSEMSEVYASITKMSVVARKVFASNLMDGLSKNKERLESAIELAKRLEDEGLSEDEFSQLADYTQYDVLMQLLNCGTEANKRNEAMALLAKRGYINAKS